MRIPGLLLAAAAMVVSAPASARDAAGVWTATLQVTESVSLPLVFRIARDDAGALTGTMDSPTQGGFGIPLAGITASEDRLRFEAPSVQGVYEGTWDEASQAWKGEWSQSGSSWPLDLSAPPPPPPLPADWSLPSDDALEAMIAARNAPRAGQGIVIGVLGPEGRRVVAGGAPFDADMVFEIGSISKVFTALILADMVNKGEVSLDDPAERYLPEGHTMPERGGRKIALRDLSTHMSGLPRLPDNMPYGDAEDPYVDYTEALLLAFLDDHTLTRDVGERWEYSNLAVGLLGYLLGRAAGTDYETLLRERITGPLGMSDTSVALSADQQARFAPALDAYMRPTKPWNLSVLTPAGGIRSTAGDMLRFAAAALDPASPIGPAMATALGVRVPVGSGEAQQALGWQIGVPGPGREATIHNGGTGGFRTSLVLDRAEGRAAVVLVNSAAEPSATDLAMHAVFGMQVSPTPAVPPLPAAVTPRAEVTLPAAELDRVTGTYDFGNGVVFEITRAGDGLRAQRKGSATGPVLPIFPEAELAFFYKAIDAQFRLIADESGKVTDAEFVQGGITLTGKRVEP